MSTHDLIRGNTNESMLIGRSIVLVPLSVSTPSLPLFIQKIKDAQVDVYPVHAVGHCAFRAHPSVSEPAQCAVVAIVVVEWYRFADSN